MPEGYGDKTEQPTERRRNEARQKGNVARSVDLNAAGLMLAVAAVLMVAIRTAIKGSMPRAMAVRTRWSMWPSAMISRGSRSSQYSDRDA